LYSVKLQHSQKRIRSCAYLIQINGIDLEPLSFPSEEPRRTAIYWRSWLVPRIRTLQDP
jgi:hypothetical protein